MDSKELAWAAQRISLAVLQSASLMCHWFAVLTSIVKDLPDSR